jgi:hypothetical protein
MTRFDHGDLYAVSISYQETSPTVGKWVSGGKRMLKHGRKSGMGRVSLEDGVSELPVLGPDC